MARQLVIELVGEASKFTKSLDEAGKSAEGWGDKIANAGKKMTAFATVPIVGFLGAATKAAAEDAAAQANLAKTLENVLGATSDTTAEVEKFIGKQMKLSTFTDDELRPSMEQLVRSTGELESAQHLMGIAMDVAAGKGIPLEVATQAVAKAQAGQFAAVNKLVPGLVDLSDKNLTARDAVRALATTFEGQAAAATETAAGKTKMMTRDLGELTEQMGSALVPILSKVVDFITPLIEKFSNMSSGTQTAILIVLGLVAAIGPLISVVGALSAAFTFLAANPVVLIIAGIAALAAGLVFAYKKSETFRNIVDGAFNAVRTAVEVMWNFVEPIFKVYVKYLETIWNVAGKVAGVIGKIGGGIGGVLGKIPGFAVGGTVPGTPGAPQLAMVHGGEHITSLRDQASGRGGGGSTVVVNVAGSVITERDLGRVVADVLRDNALIGVS